MGWNEGSTHGYIIVTNSPPATPHSGSWLAWLGDENNEVSYISQGGISIGASTTLRLWYWINSEDACGNDYGYVQVNSITIQTWNLCSINNTYGWAMLDLNLAAYIGQAVTLSVVTTSNSSLYSGLLIDDVSLIPPPTISGNAGIAGATLNYTGGSTDRKSTRLNSSHIQKSRMPSSA